MPPRKAPGARSQPTRKSSQATSANATTTRSARATTSRRRVVESDDEDEQTDEKMTMKSAKEEPSSDGEDSHTVALSKSQRAVSQGSLRTASSSSRKSDPRVETVHSEVDQRSSSPNTSNLMRSRRMVEEDEPEGEDESGTQTALGDASQTSDPDKSDSVDADATFVAPNMGSDQGPSSSLGAASQMRPRFSVSSPAGGSQPSTPTGRSSMLPLTPAAAKSNKRLVIHKLILQDFKSYAGVQTIGPFHKSFSSVVGPNGSGKSNVIDALLFVFGWRANKMRQGKLGELIHASSLAGQVKPSQTRVSVVFREIEDLPGPDAYRVVPKSKLIVSRIAYQNNTSIYQMNGKKSSFTEVTTLLREKGIDLDHKRFLILQGEVESIAQMPPKARTEHEEGLLEYLEDIIGTSRFKEEIEVAAKTVDERNEQRGERLGRLKIVQREKDAMEGKKREAESLLRDQNALTQKTSMLWQIYMWESRAATEKAKTTIASLNERIVQEREKHKGAQANVATLESSYAILKKEWEENKKEVDKLSKEVEKYEREDVQLGEKRKHFETKRKKLSKSLGEDKHHLSEARSTLSSADQEIQQLRSELSKLESSLETEEASLDTIRDSLKGKTGHLSSQIDDKQRELAPWMSKVKDKEGARDVKAQEIQLIREKEEARETEVESAREQRRALKDELRGQQEEVHGLKQERAEVHERIAAMQETCESIKADETKLRAKASAARAKADEAKSTQQASASQSGVLASLTKQSDLGMIKGFLGRLGSLGVIDDKYDVAISTACPGLDSIVVETVECGQACIEHLRKNNVGRANFILLDSVSNLRVDPVQTPENVPRLVDLVRPRDVRFLPAFYHQLRDTLVARDLAHANRIAYGAKRWRVVTLDGQLIDKSGTMSGGGTRVARGGMSSKFADAEYSPEQVARLVQESARLDGELQSIATKLQKVEAELRGLRERPHQIEMEIEKRQMALKVGIKRLEEATKRIEELRSQSQPDESESSRLEQLQTEMTEAEAEVTKLRSKTSSIEGDIALLQEKILDAGGVALRSQQSKVEGLREMIDLSTEKLTKSEVAKSKAEKDIVKYGTSLDKAEKAMTELEQEMSGLQSSASDKGSVASEARSRLNDQQHALDVKQEKRDELKQTLDESSSTINAFRSLELEIKQKLEDNQRSLADNEKRRSHYEDKHSGLELHYIEGDDDAEDADETDEAVNDNAGSGDEATSARAKRALAATELSTFSDEDLASFSKDAIKEDIAAVEERVQKGSGNFAVLEEYRKRQQEFLSRAKDLDQTTQERDAAKQKLDDLRRQRLDEFMAGFHTISSKLKEMYQTITLGGNAELELVDSLDPFSEGILFSVMPPKKSWKNISNLSGGEKTLSSLALVFALHAFKPTPLYVMDEIDAALDFRNVSIVANLIKERTKNAQFVIISLRNNMFELASRLVGIYKTNGQTKSLAVENTELSEAVAEEAAIASAMLAASARKAKAYPNPAKTPSSVSQHNRVQALSQTGSVRMLNGGVGKENSLPSTPLSSMRRGLNVPPSSSQPALKALQQQRPNNGLPQTPFSIPQTPRVPKSILSRTPRVPSGGDNTSPPAWKSTAGLA